MVVDYAHTDDALRNLLETARPLSAKRLITVFGCGGDRDRSKRPLMGMVAARLSDVVVITSDNPRSEDPARIIEEIERGIPAGSQASSRAPVVESVVDRAAAIERAVAMAAAGDVVLIAGKGHEKYQQIGDRVLPFDDGEVARAALAKRRRANGLVVSGPIALAAGTIAAAMNGRLVTGDDDRYVTGFSIDSRTLAIGRSVLRDRGQARRPRLRGGGVAAARGGHRGEPAGRRSATSNEAFVIEVAGHDAGAAGPRAVRAARVGSKGRGHYRQRRQDHDEGHDRGVDRHALPGGEERGELEQPPRPAALVAGAEARGGCGGDGTGHESRG